MSPTGAGGLRTEQRGLRAGRARLPAQPDECSIRLTPVTPREQVCGSHRRRRQPCRSSSEAHTDDSPTHESSGRGSRTARRVRPIRSPRHWVDGPAPWPRGGAGRAQNQREPGAGALRQSFRSSRYDSRTHIEHMFGSIENDCKKPYPRSSPASCGRMSSRCYAGIAARAGSWLRRWSCWRVRPISSLPFSVGPRRWRSTVFCRSVITRSSLFAPHNCGSKFEFDEHSDFAMPASLMRRSR